MNPDSEARRESARQADGKFGFQEHAEPAAGMEALKTSSCPHGNTVPSCWCNDRETCDPCIDAGCTDDDKPSEGWAYGVTSPWVKATTEQAKTALGGPEKLAVAKNALWRTVLWSERPEAYYLRDADGVLAGIVQNEDAANADYLNFDRDTWSLTPLDFTPGDIDPESKAKVEADFEQWIAENEDAVEAFTEAVSDPDGGDPAESLAHNWWLTRNGHGTGFKDVLTEDADLNRVEALGSFVGRTVDTEDGPGRVVHTGEDGWHRVIVNGHGYDYPPGSVTPNDSPMSRPERSVRRADALTALDKATPTREYHVYVGDDGKVYVD